MYLNEAPLLINSVLLMSASRLRPCSRSTSHAMTVSRYMSIASPCPPSPYPSSLSCLHTTSFALTHFCMNTYPSSTPSPPRPPPLVVPPALAARGANPPGPVDLTSSREEVLPTRTGLATISTVAAPPPRAATRASFWDRVGAFLGYAGRSEEERVQRQLVVRVIYAFAFTAAQVCAPSICQCRPK